MSKRTLRAFLVDTFAKQNVRLHSVRSFTEYASVVNTLERFDGKPVLLAELTDELVAEYLCWLRGQGRAAATLNKHRAHLLALWRYALRRKQKAGPPPDVDKARELKRLPEAWSVDELTRILSSASRLTGLVCGTPACRFWVGLILLIYDTGLRIAATMQLRRESIDFDTGQLIATAETQKQAADQLFVLHAQTLSAIRGIGHNGDLLFAWPFDRDGHYKTLRRHYRRILKQAGLPLTRQDMFHKLRRTSATQLANVAGEQTAMRHLGHSSVWITRRYLDPAKLERPDVASLLPRPKIP